MPFPLSPLLRRQPTQTIVMTGAEQTVFISTTKKAIKMAYIDFTEAQATDVFAIRTYIQLDSTSAFVVYGNMVYPDPVKLDVSKPMMYFTDLPVAYAIKVTVQQTAGAARTLYYTTFSLKYQ